MLDISVLGPVTVRRGRDLVPVPGRTQRTLLALVALHRPYVMQADRLVEELWTGPTPQNPRNALQQSVVKLRAALGVDSAALLTTSEHAYLLDGAIATLDAEQFTGLVHRAQADLTAGSLDAAQRDFRAALQLWRGDPYPELSDLPAARAETERLRELRLSALEGRIEVDLALEPPEAVVVELVPLVEAHPMRERLWRHLMVALYRSGRQVEALDTYRRARRVLREEAGVEPGADLRRTQALVLAHDPSLDVARSSVRGTPPAFGALFEAVRTVSATIWTAGLEPELCELLLAFARALNSPPVAYDHQLWLAELDAARPVLEIAVGWAVEHDRASEALALTVELARYWDHRRLLEPAVEMLERVVQAADGPTSTRSEALTWLAFFRFESGDREAALNHLEEAEQEALRSHDPARRAGAKAVGSVVLRDVDATEARIRAAAAVDLFVEHGNRRETAYGWTTHSIAALADGRPEEASTSAAAALALYAELGDRRGLAWAKSTQAAIAEDAGDHRGARSLRADARAVALAVEDERTLGLLD